MHFKKGMKMLERLQKRAMRTIRTLKNMAYGEMLNKLTLFRSEKNELKIKMTTVFKYVRSIKSKLFPVVTLDRTCGSEIFRNVDLRET